MNPFVKLLATAVLLSACVPCNSADDAAVPHIRMEILKTAEWDNIETAVDRALRFLVRNQQEDGSFSAPMAGQPAVTSLGIMAILSSGHEPRQGPYAESLNRALDYVLSTQRSNGALAWSAEGQVHNQTVAYNHAITGLMLGEAYGMTEVADNQKIATAIRKAIGYTRRLQASRKRVKNDEGGWRYPKPWGPNDSDLSITSWQLMFYRSAKNAGFEVPGEYIQEAVGYVRRCFDQNERAFVYALQQGPDRERYASGGVVGGGIIALAMSGEHRSNMVLQAGDWILDHPFDRYNRRDHPEDRYHYSAFYCSQAMYQIGGRHWEQFYPEFSSVLLKNQNSDGSWDAESRIHDRDVGNMYTTSLVVLALTPPWQILPIYQR